MPLPTVVLIGRVNVGKSSLFNRLTESSKALVSDIPGTTRDKNEGLVEWEGKYFRLTDTGGVDLSQPDEVEQKVIDHVWAQLAQADLILLVTDAKDGVIPADETIAQELRKRGLAFLITPNKADSPSLRENANEFLSLGSEIFPVSAVNGSGTGDLLDAIHERVDWKKPKKDDGLMKKGIAITMAGVPNVGKSSLLNALLGREEVIVSGQPHTTREARDLYLNYKDQDFTLIDTAGIRKISKMRKFLMRKSAEYTMDSIDESDWVIFVIDATLPKWGEQERYILDKIIRSGSSLIVAANKWDLLKGEDRFKEFTDRWTRSFGTFPWIPIIPISAKNGWHVNKLLDAVMKFDKNRKRSLPQSALDRLLKEALKRRRPQKKKGPKPPYVHAIHQVDTEPPTFEIVIDHQDTLAESWVRFIEKMLRRKFDFTATPVRVFVRSIR